MGSDGREGTGTPLEGEDAKYRWRDRIKSEVGPRSTVRLALLVLADRMEADGGACYPGLTTIARWTGLSERALQTCLQEAVETGWLLRGRRGLRGQGWTYQYWPALPPRLEGAPAPAATEPEPAVEPDVRRIFDYWQRRRSEVLGTGGRKMLPTAARLSKVRARLREGYSPEDLEEAVEGCLGNEFNVNKGHVDLELICRSQQKVEQYLAWRREQTNGKAAPPEYGRLR